MNTESTFNSICLDKFSCCSFMFSCCFDREQKATTNAIPVNKAVAAVKEVFKSLTVESEIFGTKNGTKPNPSHSIIISSTNTTPHDLILIVSPTLITISFIGVFVLIAVVAIVITITIVRIAIAITITSATIAVTIATAKAISFAVLL